MRYFKFDASPKTYHQWRGRKGEGKARGGVGGSTDYKIGGYDMY